MEVPVVDGDSDGNGHVDNVGVARLFHEARREWLLSLEGRPPGFIYVVRHLEISYLGEAFPDAVMRVGVRAIARGRTSLTLEQTLCADDLVAATATAVHVAFAREEHHAVELWPDVLASIEARQGELPPTNVGGS
jgi:acyl-CoA thioesterase FadM